ncbi:BamA/TamA family outer membrane protein [Mucilaginibacter pallidiroseus]|uniref:BamA/TamA family outer membrane protein n=1 Tax=Mucilaginibacter pallidiroseus TaxID=2599295 RepID=A0A563UH19_9SPHI|nr:BamA/TamA family outer membrane protein [Mucilaginibacter pallidiroseus]TWR30667.1 BamA/TamA family outer membrane protein [Mucilaginibacter pallidiroseus]
MVKYFCLCVGFASIVGVANAQTDTTAVALTPDTAKKQVANDPGLNQQYDIADLFRDVFHPNKKPDTLKQKSGITIIPNVASNPSIGFQIGIKAVAGKVLGGNPKTTLLSVAATSVSITTKNIIYFYLTHNVYTPGNKWNFQGSLVAAKTVTPDFGIGIGNAATGSIEDEVLSNPSRKPYVLNAYYFNLREKVYKQIDKGLFLGAGISIDARTSIKDRKTPEGQLTPYNIYTDRYGFRRDKYFSNGFLFNVQYTTRDNQNRAYKGIYADAGIRVNQTWIGSDKNAVQLNTDFRKYFSLSSTNPEHVLAFWNWTSFVVGGALPYLELPGTGRDGNFRSGRGYTVTYFKGTQYFYSEMEYRFPILANKFISGVTFLNVQTANDDLGTKLFDRWQPGGGAGLRVLFNKATRTNLCIDYAWGKYGARGLFLGLNEAF